MCLSSGSAGNCKLKKKKIVKKKKVRALLETSSLSKKKTIKCVLQQEQKQHVSLSSTSASRESTKGPTLKYANTACVVIRNNIPVCTEASRTLTINIQLVQNTKHTNHRRSAQTIMRLDFSPCSIQHLQLSSIPFY